MGATCSANKKNSKTKNEEKQQAKDVEKENPIVYIPQIKSQSGSKKCLESNDLPQDQLVTKKLLIQFKRFGQMLELLGNLDHIAAETRNKINQLIIIRSNISIVIQNNIKKILRQQQIMKRPEEDDQYLLYPDAKFADTLKSQMHKIYVLIEQQLSTDEEFESAFPILSVSLCELGEDLQKILNQS